MAEILTVTFKYYLSILFI